MSIAAPTLALALFALVAAPSDQPVFAPAPGLRLEKTVRSEFQLDLESWTCRTNGTAVPSEYLPDLDLSNHERTELVWTDEYLASAANHPQRVRRSFSKLGTKETDEVSINGTQVASTERIGTSALETCVVLLDASAGAERCKLERGECGRELLDRLPLDVDLTAFLPAEGSAKEWELDGSAFNLVPEHLAGVRFTYDRDEDEVHIDAAQLERDFRGTWKVTRGAVQESGGRRSITLALRGEFTTSCEIESELRNVPVAKGKTRETSQVKISAEGEIVWDLERNVLRAAAVRASYAMQHHTETLEKTDSGAPAYDQDMDFEGKLELAIETGTVP